MPQTVSAPRDPSATASVPVREFDEVQRDPCGAGGSVPRVSDWTAWTGAAAPLPSANGAAAPVPSAIPRGRFGDIAVCP